MSPVPGDAVEGDMPPIAALYGAEVEGLTATFGATPPDLPLETLYGGDPDGGGMIFARLKID